MRCCISTTNEHIRKIVLCVSLVIVVWVGVVKVTLWWERLPTICKNYIVVVIITIIYNYFLYQKHNKLLSYFFNSYKVNKIRIPTPLFIYTSYIQVALKWFFHATKVLFDSLSLFFVNAFNNWSTYTCSNTI